MPDPEAVVEDHRPGPRQINRTLGFARLVPAQGVCLTAFCAAWRPGLRVRRHRRNERGCVCCSGFA